MMKGVGKLLVFAVILFFVTEALPAWLIDTWMVKPEDRETISAARGG